MSQEALEHSDAEIHALSSKFDTQVLEEASYILWYIHRSNPSSPYATLSACIAALNRGPALHEALKNATQSGNYDAVRSWRSSESSRPVPGPSPSKSDAQVQSAVDTFLSELRLRIVPLVAGGFSLPLWSPPEDIILDPATRDHLRDLHIPALKGKPSLLLHNLGRFRHDERLKRRLENIFMPNSHTFLVNTSGSGKTRLLLEGLCTHWGFYFTSLVDSSLLGSSDVQNAISTHIPTAPAFRTHLPPSSSPAYDNALKANRDIAAQVFRRVFLARVLVFALFVEEMEKLRERQRGGSSQMWEEEVDRDEGVYEEEEDEAMFQERWLLLQLHPSLLHPRIWDPFEHLATNVLSRASDAYISSTTHCLLSHIRLSLSNAQPPPSAPSTCPPFSQSQSQSQSQSSFQHPPHAPLPPQPLFCILDEAQHAASQHLPAFRSSSPHGAHRPILRELVRAWEGAAAAHGVFLLVSGTGISKDAVDQAMASAIMKEGRYRWCSDTGAFEVSEDQAEWVRPYLPCGWAEGKEGRRLMERVWYWLHGRHRFTAGFVSELLVNGFRRPHGLLNAYIEHFTQFRVTDAQDLVQAEGEEPPLPVLSQYKLDFSKLKKNPDMLSTIHQLTTHYLMRAVLPHTLGSDEATYVQHGFARFLGADASAQSVTIDEPLVLLAAARWINVHHRTSYKHFAKQIAAHEHASNGFENYLAFCVDLAFSKGRRKVGEVFTLSGSTGTAGRAWAEMEAELVSLYRPETSGTGSGGLEYAPMRQYTFSGPSATLGTNAKTPEETLAWLAHSCHTPICFPHSSLGPDLLFVLRLEDGTFLWVALQAKYSLGKNGFLSRPFLRRAMRSVTPSCFFMDKDGNPYSPTTHPTLAADTTKHLAVLPHARTDAGRYSLLRVVASFPAQPNLKRCLEEDPDTDGHPIASMNIGLLKQLTHKLSPKDFLQGLEDPLQREAVKRKRGDDSIRGKRTKKLKLN